MSGFFTSPPLAYINIEQNHDIDFNLKLFMCYDRDFSNVSLKETKE